MADGSKNVSDETSVYSASSYDRIKKNEDELFELVKLSAVPMDRRLFDVVLELLKLNVSPASILEVLNRLRPDVSTPDEIRSHSPVDPAMFGLQALDTVSLVSSDSLSNPDVSAASIPRSTHILSDTGTSTPTGLSAPPGDPPARSSPKREKKKKSGHTPKKHRSGSKKAKDPGS